MAASWAARLVGVVRGLERQQGCGLRIAAALEGVRDQPVGESGFLGSAGPCRYVPITPL